MTTLLHCENIHKDFQTGNHLAHILKNVNFQMNQGEMVAILGSSGSGKSTLLHLLGGLEQPTSGKICLLGEDLQQLQDKQLSVLRNQHLGFVYQFHHLMMDFSALENVMMPLLIAKTPRKEAESRAMALLEAVGLKDRMHHQPAMLSGGERQRVAIARALVNRPSLVLADEPTGNLDQKNAQSILALLKDLNQQQGTAFLVVTHDMALAEQLPRQCVMKDGVLTEKLR